MMWSTKARSRAPSGNPGETRCDVAYAIYCFKRARPRSHWALHGKRSTTSASPTGRWRSITISRPARESTTQSERLFLEQLAPVRVINNLTLTGAGGHALK